MPRYSTDSLTFNVDYHAARNQMRALTDEQLETRLRPAMIPGVNANVWLPAEPEHEQLADILRAQADSDLECAYFGSYDPHCDDRLARYTEHGLPTLHVLYVNDELGDDDYDEVVDANPVARLRALGFPMPITAASSDLAGAINAILEDLPTLPIAHDVRMFDPRLIRPARRRVLTPTGNPPTFQAWHDAFGEVPVVDGDEDGPF